MSHRADCATLDLSRFDTSPLLALLKQIRRTMGTGRTDEVRKDAVRIALTSGLTRRRVADDLGVGLSTLNKWGPAHRDTDVVSPKDRELAQENELLRRKNRILKEERDIFKRGEDQKTVRGLFSRSPVLRKPKAMR